MRPSKIAERTLLRRLEIEDFGLIASAELEFADGFTACTGETGSGKTMVLGALAFVLGERAAADDVRTGASRARATLHVEPDAALRETLHDDGFEFDADEPAIFTRELQASGKTSARINGRAATAAQLRAYAERLLEAIGQHEHQRLLSSAYQTELLDTFAGDQALELRAEIAAGYEHTNALARSVRDIVAGSERAAAELDEARLAIREIDETAPVTGEDDLLRRRRDYLTNGERIAAALDRAHAALTEAESAATETLGTAAAAVASVARFSPALATLAATLGALQSDANDAAAALAREREMLEFDAAELDRTTARLDHIERLKKKYGGSIASILAARAAFADAADDAADHGERERAAAATLARAREKLTGDAAALSQLRAQAARRLEQRLDRELAALAMPAARFSVVLSPLAEPGPGGAERVEFTLSPNPGEPVRALARAASGGELSRVLLALVVVLSAERGGTALIFDEIDAGIGGAAASAVAERLGALARRSQVLCVTHLAQIAARADRHYALRKRSNNDTTLIELVELEESNAVQAEIARMLSGNTSPVALRHAETLLNEARAHCPEKLHQPSDQRRSS
ncbi:MAG: DNA repair protein RecN [Candidatus Eremiobacteraeota bacterium]|nr:DNA repair protein RecN [Candidatus Eremiobacteraeota bacterium]MBC5804236.1 DNA repair protein RecN [Candidatus Eremiobacteraeota bacterium]MBC5820387.1 DNA repair protein RecN [Candidatus Eremiobacteraeota bacterium]